MSPGAGTDPAVHRQCEQLFVQHAQRLLDDDRLRLDTTAGRRVVTGLGKTVKLSDQEVDLKRLMSEMNKPDRALQQQMPVGMTIDVTLTQSKWLVLRSTVGRLKVACVSPTRELLAGQDPAPLTPSQVKKILSDLAPASVAGVPSTMVLMATAGFTLEAHELADRRADRTVILVEPNRAGGWTAYGPLETKALVDLFDPEADDAKRSRVREELDASRAELTGSGIATDRVAGKTQLPLHVVESEFKAYAKATPGLVAKRLDGRVVLFQAGSAPESAPSAIGGGDVPLIDRIKLLFARKGENEKKIAFLSERRVALSQQRDRGYEGMAALEKQEADLREQFKTAGGEITKRRVTTQLLQLRKDIERRQQLLQVLNQQVNVVSTHLHNLELVHQGQKAQLPSSDEVAADATKAEEMLAQLEADTELASTVGGTSVSGMSAEEQALYEELEREHSASPTAATTPTFSDASTSTHSTPPSAGGEKSAALARPQPEAEAG